jgi:hypothetical protein
MDIWWGIPGWIALIVLIVEKVRDIRGAKRPLVMKVRSAHVLWHEGNGSIVAFRLDFANHSSRVHAVHDLQIVPPDPITHKTFLPSEIDESRRVAIYRLPTGEDWKVPTSESLQIPLDIPPHQSRHTMFAVCLQFPEPSTTLTDFFPWQFHFFAFGFDNDQIATDSIQLFLEQLRTVGIYTRQYLAKMKPKKST